jgi:hypothetical protein
VTLATEMRRLERESVYMFGSRGQDGIESEVPMMIHSREVDSGGSPEWHEGFERYLMDAGVCFCAEPTSADPRPHRFPCNEVYAKLREPTNRAHPRRLKRAFRQLRDIDPVAYDIVWLLVGRRMHWVDVVIKINDERVRRGQEPFEDHEMSVFAISGVSLLSAAF